MTAAPRPNTHKPWSLWPIAIAIVVCLAGYTWVRLAYAKPGKPHEPFAESRQRYLSAKLESAGWRWSEASYEALVDLPAPEVAVRKLAVRPEPAGELFLLTTENWHLPIAYTVVAAPPRALPGADYAVHFQVELDQARAHIVSFDVYRKGADLVVVPRWEPYPPELTPRRPKLGGRLLIPASALPVGHSRVTLLALKQSSQWEFEVAAP